MLDYIKVNELQAKSKLTGKIKNKDIAKECGVAEITVSHWLSGKHSPKSDYIKKIAKLFNVSSDDILKG